MILFIFLSSFACASLLDPPPPEVDDEDDEADDEEDDVDLPVVEDMLAGGLNALLGCPYGCGMYAPLGLALLLPMMPFTRP